MKSHSAQDPHDKEWYHDLNREHTCSIIGKLHLLRGIRSEIKGTIKGQLLENQSKIKTKTMNFGKSLIAATFIGNATSVQIMDTVSWKELAD